MEILPYLMSDLMTPNQLQIVKIWKENILILFGSFNGLIEMQKEKHLYLYQEMAELLNGQ
jgi:hypothetical protein